MEMLWMRCNRLNNINGPSKLGVKENYSMKQSTQKKRILNGLKYEKVFLTLDDNYADI